MGNRAGKNKKAITTRTIFTALFHSFVKSFTEPLQGKARKRKISSRQPVGNISTEWKNVCAHCLFAAALTVTSVVASQIQAQAHNPTQQYNINIPAVNVAEALNQLADQTDKVMLFPYQDAKARQANSVVGRYTLMHALTILLKNSGLVGGFSENGAISISRGNDWHLKQGREENNDMNTNTNTKKTLLAAAIGLFAAGGASLVLAQEELATQQSRIDEIVVTANKRGTGISIQDTAMAISALTGEIIEKRGLVGMDDYLRTLPGVSMQDRGAGQNTVIIRGIAAADTQGVDASTAAIYFGETPITDLGSVSVSDASGNADIKLVDIQRIEVLRGPQGTLYGSGSMGGTVRTIPNPPNLSEVEGKVAVRYSQTGEAGGTNTMQQGVLNIPLVEDTLAIRGVAYRFDNSGYIDNVAASQSDFLADGIAMGGQARDRGDVGSEEYTGFRLSTLWQASDDLSVMLAHTQQEIDQDGIPEVNLDLPQKFQQVRLDVGLQGDQRGEFLKNEIDITNLVLEYDLGWGSLLSSTSWIDYNTSSATDLSQAFGAAIFSPTKLESDILIEELRFVSQFEGPWQILAGLYYEDNSSKSMGAYAWSGNPGDNIGLDTEYDFDEETVQKAFFAELSYQFSEEWEATLGVRRFDYDLQRDDTSSGAFAEPPSNVEFDDDGDTFKANLTYKPSEDTLVYGQWAEGYRRGRPVYIPSLCLDPSTGRLNDLDLLPQEGVESDSLENFEIGFKTSLNDNRVTLNAAVYRVNWDGIPISLFEPSCGQFFGFNAGSSTSEGFELEVQAKLTPDLNMGFSASYGEATLSEDAPNLGDKGDNLPGSADVNASINVEYNFTLAGMAAFVYSDYSYVHEYYHTVDESGVASGGYTLLNLKAGVTLSSFNIDLYVNNLTNVDDLTWVESTFPDFGMNRAYRLRPRTVGLNIGYQF